MLFKSICQFKRKIVASSLIEMKDNLNLSRGQWTPDIVDNTLMKHSFNEVIPPLENQALQFGVHPMPRLIEFRANNNSKVASENQKVANKVEKNNCFTHIFLNVLMN
ncbi:hypothetical protein SK128_025232 [Halocaridina rubra]|uniref:Uncharacterized protein n=1 Tax=Halocaridina rubra TaxID=373956 RepID=A0AAN8ZXX3_HALRR